MMTGTWVGNRRGHPLEIQPALTGPLISLTRPPAHPHLELCA